MVTVSQEVSSVHPYSIAHKGSLLSSRLTERWADQDPEIKTLSRPSQPCQPPPGLASSPETCSLRCSFFKYPGFSELKGE